MNFLSLRFCVKPILEILELPNLPFLRHLGGLNWGFYEFLQLWMLKCPQKRYSEHTKMEKTAVLELLDSPELISLEIWMTEKCSIFHTVSDTFFFIFTEKMKFKPSQIHYLDKTFKRYLNHQKKIWEFCAALFQMTKNLWLLLMIINNWLFGSGKTMLDWNLSNNGT